LAAGAETVVITTTQGLQSHDGCTDNFVDGLQLPIGPEPIAVAFTTAEGELSGGDLVSVGSAEDGFFGSVEVAPTDIERAIKL
jgi:hypothetical protein